jgi:hypothetical protein
MALTQLADVIEPDIWQDYLSLRSSELSEILASGIAQSDPRFSALLAGAGTLFQMPHFKDLPDTEAVIGTDTTATITPQKITTGQGNAVRHFRVQAWASTDILPSFIGPDPMMEIASKVAEYWVRQDQRTLVASIQGVLADNVANDSSDLVNDIYSDIASPLAANKISATAVLDTLQLLGDVNQVISGMFMHSAVMTELKKQNLIDFIPNARGEVVIPTYLGKRVVQDDGVNITTGTNSDDYQTVFYAPGAFGFAEGQAKNPVATEREELQGNGWGLETLVSRREMLLHPMGWSFLNASVAGNSPTNTELENAANWDRVVEPTESVIRLVALQSNI